MQEQKHKKQGCVDNINFFLLQEAKRAKVKAKGFGYLTPGYHIEIQFFHVVIQSVFAGTSREVLPLDWFINLSIRNWHKDE